MTVKISGTNYGRKYPPEGGAAALPRPNPARTPMQKSHGEVMDTKESKSSGAVESGSSAASNGVAQPMPRAPVLNGSHANGSVARVTAPEAPHEAANGVVVAHDEPMAWPRSDASAWLAAYEAIQCRTAEAHALYQQTMAQCHLAFLHAAEQSALALASVAAGAPVRALSAASSSAALPALPAPQWSARPARAPAPSARVEASPGVVARHAVDAPPRRPVSAPPAAARTAVSAVAPAVAEAPRPQTPAPAPAASPAAPAAKSNGAIALPADGDLQSFLLTIVSEKTGYPKDILNLDQQLEADLGIDSIKRVEILSAFEGHVPDIKDVNLEEVAKLATLRDVLGFMERYADKLGLEKKRTDERAA